MHALLPTESEPADSPVSLPLPGHDAQDSSKLPADLFAKVLPVLTELKVTWHVVATPPNASMPSPPAPG